MQIPTTPDLPPEINREINTFNQSFLNPRQITTHRSKTLLQKLLSSRYWDETEESLSSSDSKKQLASLKERTLSCGPLLALDTQAIIYAHQALLKIQTKIANLLQRISQQDKKQAIKQQLQHIKQVRTALLNYLLFIFQSSEHYKQLCSASALAFISDTLDGIQAKSSMTSEPPAILKASCWSTVTTILMEANQSSHQKPLKQSSRLHQNRLFKVVRYAEQLLIVPTKLAPLLPKKFKWHHRFTIAGRLRTLSSTFFPQLLCAQEVLHQNTALPLNPQQIHMVNRQLNSQQRQLNLLADRLQQLIFKGLARFFFFRKNRCTNAYLSAIKTIQYKITLLKLRLLQRHARQLDTLINFPELSNACVHDKISPNPLDLQYCYQYRPAVEALMDELAEGMSNNDPHYPELVLATATCRRYYQLKTPVHTVDPVQVYKPTVTTPTKHPIDDQAQQAIRIIPTALDICSLRDLLARMHTPQKPHPSHPKKIGANRRARLMQVTCHYATIILNIRSNQQLKSHCLSLSEYEQAIKRLFSDDPQLFYLIERLTQARLSGANIDMLHRRAQRIIHSLSDTVTITPPIKPKKHRHKTPQKITEKKKSPALSNTESEHVLIPYLQQ